jgi:hypothetical protein
VALLAFLEKFGKFQPASRGILLTVTALYAATAPTWPGAAILALTWSSKMPASSGNGGDSPQDHSQLVGRYLIVLGFLSLLVNGITLSESSPFTQPSP